MIHIIVCKNYKADLLSKTKFCMVNFFYPTILLSIDFICFEEVKEKSSLYGLNILGYTCATRVKTIRCESVNSSKTLKIIKVRIVD